MALLDQLGISKKRWMSANVTPSQDITQTTAGQYGTPIATVSTLLGSGNRAARDRQSIYFKWQAMEQNPICSSALKLLVTAALGGHETTGDTIFIEKTPEAEKDKRLGTLVDEINKALSAMLNESAYDVGYIGSSFGDAYARIYSNASGVTHLYHEELVRPPIVQAYERGGKTIGYSVATGERSFEKLDVTQMARLKMPRMQYVPQYDVVQKAIHMALREDDSEQLPIMPSAVGGSLSYAAEMSYDNLTAALMGLVGQRWVDSIDEQLVTVNMESMTKDQQDRFMSNLKAMLVKSKQIAEDAVKNNVPFLGRLRHIIPVNNEKQVANITPAGSGAGRGSAISIEDVILHAKLLSGAYGVDLSMLGFADLLSGGLGEGGFFRTSAQAAEVARVIRGALSGFCNHVIDIHCLKRYGFVFPEKNRPWKINFYGSISALESERQTTKANAMNGALILAQAIDSFKNTGATVEMMENFLSKELLLDEEQAKLYAKIVKQKTEEEGGNDFGGGGFGGKGPEGFGS